MSESIISSTQVSPSMYVERSSDAQIKHIIDEMARPGYVLVARQMGKTNLLLHTKDRMQDEMHVFVYADFSIMSSFTERECLNYLIDTAIDINFEVFSEAEKQIAELRGLPSYNASRMFTRELRILLKYVDKIVFLLDEIDALTRTDYSDRVFSIIRGHYYANANYPELKKATFILSGVIEPKDIIKDTNISPFNIGEKIYMSDFTRSEFSQLINHSEYLLSQGLEVADRLYYWTGGQPRLSWDLCSAAESKKVTTPDDVDDLVKSMYLTSFDMAPIDSIREKVKVDSEFRDALIQLCIDKGNSLSDDVKRKLYLAGIINYNQTIPGFKNQILAHSFSYDWLISLQSQEVNFLNVADTSIHLERNYKKAISHLDKFFDNNPTDAKEISKAHYLMGEAYFRSYQPEKALLHLDSLSKLSHNEYSNRGVLLTGYNYAAGNKLLEAEECFKRLLKDVSLLNSDIYFEAIIGLANVLIQQNTTDKLAEAKKLILENLSRTPERFVETHQMAPAMYYLACIEEQNKDYKQCVYYLDTALQSAQATEKQVLLYKKLQMCEQSVKHNVAKELFESLSEIQKRPDPEDFEDVLGFDTSIACRSIAELLLHYPEFDVLPYMRFFFYESKENAVIYIHRILNGISDSNTIPLLKYIISLFDDIEWLFDENSKYEVVISQIQELHDPSIAINIVEELSNNSDELQARNTVHLFAQLISFYIVSKISTKAQYVLNKYRALEPRIKERPEGYRILIDYFETYLLYESKEFSRFQEKASVLLRNVQLYKDNYERNDGDRLPLSDINNVINNTKKWLGIAESRLHNNSIQTIDTHGLGRNTVVKVKYLNSGDEFEGKYKKYAEDIRLGLCKLIATR